MNIVFTLQIHFLTNIVLAEKFLDMLYDYQIVESIFQRVFFLVCF